MGGRHQLKELLQMIYSLTDYLQQDLENDEYFYKNDLSTFTT
jgi:hypothetical protein